MLQFDIPDIIIKPYVRMTKRGKYVKPEAQEYLASKEELSWKIKNILQNMGVDMMPAKTSLRVIIRLFAPSEPGHRCDLDNQVKAILDACNGIAYPDDRWIDSIDAKRTLGVDPRLVLYIQENTLPSNEAFQ